MLFRSVPVLALNRDNVAPPINSASFSLAPDDEGSSAADHVASLGARRVLVLSSGDHYARGSASAFAIQLETYGGSVVQMLDRKSAVQGKRGSVCVDLGGRGIITKKKRSLL